MTYTQLETAVAGSSMDNVSFGNLTLPSGSSPMVSAAGAMDSPSFANYLQGLNTPTHPRGPDDDVGDIQVDDNGSRPHSGNGHNDGNDNI